MNRLRLYFRRHLSRALGKAAGLVLPSRVQHRGRATLHLQEIAVAVVPGALTPFCLWIGPEGMSPRSWACPKTLRSIPPTVQVTRAQSG